MPTVDELKALQSLPLSEKIMRTQTRIIEWYMKHDGNVYVSFSGGKDSTVLLTLVRQIYPDVSAVFVDTGLEFPEVKAHVKTFENVTILRPEMAFPQVVKKYGWCFPGKDVAKVIYYAKKGSKWAKMRLEGKDVKGNDSIFKQRYKKWRFLADSPYLISDACCAIMKKNPMHKYRKETGKKQYIGTMTVESKQRQDAWLKTGCNSFSGKNPRSAPLSFWTEQDILQYIVSNNLPIPSVYGDIVKTSKGLALTGEQRTGCMFCPVGCHLGKVNKWARMRHTHPKIYEYCMEKLGLREFLEYVGGHLGLDFFTEQMSLFDGVNT